MRITIKERRMKIIKNILGWRIKRLEKKMSEYSREIGKLLYWKKKGIGCRDEIEFLEGYYRIEVYKIEDKIGKLRRKYEN